ncbi:MAG: membrane protein insertion efficiency factor YidD [Bacilli bacterium]|nr:membrane protein insertion efficiency factor YidD [Bacilli bacterium]MBQ8902388.1 membrane protein insertion efficiency factor YidD [Bacilli bacterium]
MKKVLLKLIDLYQKMPLRSHSKCRFYPTCSNYAKEAIEKYGSIKGSYLTIKRILKCNPFHKGGIDLVPSRNNSCKIK